MTVKYQLKQVREIIGGCKQMIRLAEICGNTPVVERYTKSLVAGGKRELELIQELESEKAGGV